MVIYGYPPNLKTKINWQVEEMFQTIIIRHTGSLSSQVILVKKNDRNGGYALTTGLLMYK